LPLHYSLLSVYRSLITTRPSHVSISDSFPITMAHHSPSQPSLALAYPLRHLPTTFTNASLFAPNQPCPIVYPTVLRTKNMCAHRHRREPACPRCRAPVHLRPHSPVPSPLLHRSPPRASHVRSFSAHPQRSRPTYLDPIPPLFSYTRFSYTRPITPMPSSPP
jgi:hypothetical protein